jgi:hypothetical protein
VTAYLILTLSHNYSSKKKCVLQKNYYTSRCEKFTRYLKGGEVSLVLYIFTIAKMAEVKVVNKLLTCVTKYVWGNSGKCSHNELAKLRQ